ncbi:hypothetical protein KC332_g1015 [Hortaea werneckii]|nr:hypothetical protein KC358_g4413 [Hortaea werneckii]KAI6851602.1 hypothetical protein KC350_g1577 [Hortaea werneckii]KAI6929493.1 hypothetical protein KC348_g7845 [Hortaea werneckii]KAI6943982.1 hypothetical protein KC341_g1108 [Hortaea werneckii]KAI6982514.1 hypothetical protein KC321_g619 [Hortaea werneckii]
MQLSHYAVNALDNNNQETSETMQTPSADPQQQSPHLNVDDMANTTSQQPQHEGPSPDVAGSPSEVTGVEEEDPLRDLETAAEMFADSGSVSASDTAVAVNDESKQGVPTTLGVEDRLLDIFYRANVAQKASTFETMIICMKAVTYRWRVIVDADVTSQVAYINGVKYALTMSHDGDDMRVPSYKDSVRIAMSNILTDAISTSDWVDNKSGTKIFNTTFSALHIALDRLEKDMNSMQKKAKARKAVQRMPASNSRKRKVEAESPEDNTTVPSALGENDSSPVKKAKRVKKHEETEWSAAEDVELRDMRTKQNCQWWFSHTPDQRAAHFKTWLDDNHYTHTRSKNALEQRSDMWRKDLQKDPNPNGPPILTKAQCKGVGAQNITGTIVAGPSGVAGSATTGVSTTEDQGTTSADVAAGDPEADEESPDVDDIINRHLQPFVGQAGTEVGTAEEEEEIQEEEQEEEEQEQEQQEEEEPQKEDEAEEEEDEDDEEL